MLRLLLSWVYWQARRYGACTARDRVARFCDGCQAPLQEFNSCLESIKITLVAHSQTSQCGINYHCKKRTLKHLTLNLPGLSTESSILCNLGCRRNRDRFSRV